MKSPAWLPALSISVDGEPVPAECQRLLIDLRVRQRLGMPTVCELAFLDVDARLDGTALTRVGSQLKVMVAQTGKDLFTGDITGLSYEFQSGYGREVRIRGYDRLARLARRQKVRTFIRATLADIVRELTSDLDLTVVSNLQDAPFERVVQHEQTDLQLLTDLAERRGAHFFLSGAELHLMSLPGAGTVIDLALGHQLLEARFARNDVVACESVSAHGWNSWLAEPHEATRRGEVHAGTGAAPAFHAVLVNRPFTDDADAEQCAQAELAFRAARALSMSGVANGDPRLQTGGRVSVSGVEEALAGPYVLTAVSHSLTVESGFITEIDSAPIRPPKRDRSVSMTLGIVCRTDDPEALGRTQLALPALGNITTDWVQTVSPWAGAGKGFMSQADIDDTVLFAFFDADPAHGIVLGSVYGKNGPPHDWAKGRDGQCYTLVTPGGQKICLDDAHGITRIQNKGGSYVELAPQTTVLHSNVDLHIEAPGHALVMRAQTIDLERA